MIKTQRNYTRSNLDVPFYDALPQHLDYVEHTYSNTGKRVATIKTTSPDGLTLRISAAWKDQASLDEFQNDPTVIAFHFEPRRIYNQQHGIVESEQVILEI